MSAIGINSINPERQKFEGGKVSASVSAPKTSIKIDSVRPAVEAVSSDAFQKSITTFFDHYKKLVVIRQIIVIVTSPYHLYNLAKNFFFSFKKVSSEKKIDNSLDFIDNTRALGEGTGTLATALADYHFVSHASVSWTGPLAIILAPLSIASIIKNYRNNRKINVLSGEIEAIEQKHGKNGQMTMQSYHAFVSHLEKRQKEDSNFIEGVFDVKEKILSRALKARENEVGELLGSTDPLQQAKGQEILNHTLKSLKGRISKNIISSRLSMLASAINLIGTTVLLLCPINPIGWVLIGLGGIIDVSRMIHNYVINGRFKSELNIE